MIQRTTDTALPATPASDPEIRRTMLGATDMAEILTGSPLKVAMEKRGELEPEDLSDNEAVLAGVLLEEAIGDWYMYRTGRQVQHNRATWRHRDYSFIACHPDYLIHDANGLVEAKTAGITNPMTADRRDQWGDEEAEQLPPRYLIQAHYQMLVTGREFVDVAALIGGAGLRIYPVQRDEQFCDFLRKQAVEFWTRYIEGDETPPPRTTAECRLLYPRDNGAAVECPPDAIQAARDLLAVQAEMKTLAEQEDALKATLQAAMGEAEALEFDGRTLATWRTQVSRRLDTKALRAAHPDIADQFTKASESRRFLVKRKGIEGVS